MHNKRKKMIDEKIIRVLEKIKAVTRLKNIQCKFINETSS